MSPRRASMALAALALSSLLGGCMQRRLLRMQDHPSQPVLMLETLDTHTLLFAPISREHVFWQCAETGNQLTCTRACGGANPYSCPASASSVGGSNVR